MRVLIREAAYNDLDRICSWIAKDRPRSAALVVDRVLESAERLGQFPNMGHIGRLPGTHEWVVPGLPYIIVYALDHDAGEITIIAVFHAAQDPDKGR